MGIVQKEKGEHRDGSCVRVPAMLNKEKAGSDGWAGRQQLGEPTTFLGLLLHNRHPREIQKQAPPPLPQHPPNFL